MGTTVRFQVVGAGARRIVRVSPASRPELRLPQAHPSRRVGAVRAGKVASCRPARPVHRRSAWLAVRVALVGLVTVAGGSLAVGQFVADAAVGPSGQYVAGDPAWSHVQP